MFATHTGKHPFRIQSRVIHYDVNIMMSAKYAYFTDRVSDATWQGSFKTLPLVEFRCSTKERGQLPEEDIKVSSHTQSVSLRKDGFFSYTLTKQHFCHRWRFEKPAVFS